MSVTPTEAVEYCPVHTDTELIITGGERMEDEDGVHSMPINRSCPRKCRWCGDCHSYPQEKCEELTRTDMGFFKEQDGNVVPASTEDLKSLFDNPLTRRVHYDEVGKVSVSTVFLPLNHGTDLSPLFYETMIFGGKYDQLGWRYATRVLAEAGHKKILDCILRNGNPRRLKISEAA